MKDTYWYSMFYSIHFDY